MIHESKDGLAGNGCADGRTQAAQHMGLHQTALAALPVVPAACRGADAGVQVRSHGRCADRVPEVQSLQGHLGQRVGRLQKLYPLHVLAGLPALSDQHPEAERLRSAVGLPDPHPAGIPAQPYREQEDQAEGAAGAVYAQLHLGHRAVRYRPSAAECHRSGERPASHQHQLHDAAGSVPPHLHHQRHLAGCRLGIHHVHRIPF